MSIGEIDDSYIEGIDELIGELQILKDCIRCHKEGIQFTGKINERIIMTEFPECRTMYYLVKEMIEWILFLKYRDWGPEYKYHCKMRIHEISINFLGIEWESFSGEYTKNWINEDLDCMMKDALCSCFLSEATMPDILKDFKCPWSIEELTGYYDDFYTDPTTSLLIKLPDISNEDCQNVWR